MYFWRMAIESVALVLGFFSYSVIGQIFYDPKVNLTLVFLCLQPVSRKKLNSFFGGIYFRTRGGRGGGSGRNCSLKKEENP